MWTLGNERADMLVKTACNKSNTDCYFELTKNDIRKKLNQEYLVKWQKLWDK